MVRRCPLVSKAYSPKNRLRKTTKKPTTITSGENVFIESIQNQLKPFAEDLFSKRAEPKVLRRATNPVGGAVNITAARTRPIAVVGLHTGR
jgi:hypothetical protein